ncbi:PEGA domain-containing protein [Malonomonas rubra DSM 5091]|uniref:PEGA domain-containing protein n=1 Tax=Malonomonas rubra DSM 5091 TaxID=1122189 RepID=A0A1M6IS66_MALRU|nr:PEGA domain-containing protein [Malonomonas rubra]SHJ37316.1 PEGA domain-containing protein [Malonomonas rubra DSM 5091]
MKSKLLTLIVLCAFLCACAPHQALIQSEPPGAVVTIDGKEIGETPVRYDYALSSGSQHQVTISQQGYEQVDLTIKADKTDSGAMKRWLAAGVVWSPLWLGTLFTKKLKESYLFVMKRSSPQMTAKLDVEP